MDISKYLAKLVENRKEVGIPGLGTFYKKKSPGRYDTQSHSFVPPTFTLQFKTEVSEQSELAEYIHVDRNISVASANYFIGQYVEELQEKLKVFAEAEIGTVGKLVSTAGVLSFVPASPLNSDTNFFGLPKLEEEGLATNEQPATPTAEPVLQKPVEPPAVEIIPEPTVKEPVIEEPVAVKPVEQLIVSESLPVEQVKQNIPEPNVHVETPVAPVYQEPEVVTPIPVEEPVYVSKLESITNENLAIEENPGEDVEFVNPVAVGTDKNPGEIDPLFIINELVLEEEKNNFQRMAEEVPPEPEAKTPLYLIVLLGFLGILVAFLIIYFMFPTLSSDFNNNYDDSTKKKPLQEMQKPAEVVKPIDTIRTDTISKQDSALNVKSTAPITEVVDTVPATYEVIGSSPKRPIEAKQFIAEMKTKYWIRAKIVEQIPGRKMKISIGTFKTKKEADDSLPILSKKIGIDGLYTFKNTHKL